MSNKLISILDHAGSIIKEIFVKGLPAVEKVAQGAEPFVDLAFPGIAMLFNTTVQLVGNAEAMGQAAAATGQTGPQKLQAVTSALEPLAIAYLAQQGITVNSTTVEAWVNACVALLNVIPAPGPVPVTPAVKS